MRRSFLAMQGLFELFDDPGGKCLAARAANCLTKTTLFPECCAVGTSNVTPGARCSAGARALSKPTQDAHPLKSRGIGIERS